MEYSMLVQICMGAVNTLVYGWGFVQADQKRQLERHKSKAPKSDSAVVEDEESKGKE
jgi:hypothetical protein